MRFFPSSSLQLGILFLLIAASFVASSLGLEADLMKRRKKLAQEIKEVEALLADTKKEKTATLDQFKTLKAQIEKREELIATIKSEISAIDSNLVHSQDTIEVLKEDLNKYKGDYANMMRHAYRHRNANKRLLFVLSAKNFNNAMRRWQYFVRYDQQRKDQIILVGETQNYLNKKIASLSVKRDEQGKLLEENEVQQTALSKELKEIDELVIELKEKESEILEDLETKNIAKDKLTDAIDNAIRQDQAKAKTNALKQNKAAYSSKPLSASDKKEAQAFAKSKGKLPMPVKGVITGKYGLHQHPTLKKVEIKNKGIDIKTRANSEVKAVFAGVVVNIFSPGSPGASEAVMVKHGNYYTVYSNLKSVKVRKGQKVNESQVLGILGIEPTSKQSSLHFEVWNGNQHENPSKWLAK
jgi:murein hydrolase activator